MAIPRNLANIAPHVNASSTELVINDGSANLDFRVEGDGNANLIFADAGVDKVGFGTNTFNANGGVIQVSNGISFPATQSACSDANTLDDYEEGTFTPAFNQPGGFTISYTEQAGRYVKVGKMVYVYVTLTVNTISGTNASGIIFQGLPFSTVNASTVNQGSYIPVVSGWSTNFPSTVLIDTNSTSGTMYFKSNVNGAILQVLCNNIQAGASVKFGFCYETN